MMSLITWKTEFGKDESQKNGLSEKQSNVTKALLVMSLSPATSYKASQPKFYPWTIKHDSFVKAVWDWIVLLLVIYTAIEIPYNVSFVLPAQKEVVFNGRPLDIVNIIVDVMFIVDIVINFRTTYVSRRGVRVICNPKKIAHNYLKTWFVVDFLAAIPFELFGLISSNEEFTLVGLLKTARLLRLVRVARKLDRYSQYGVAVVFLLMGLFTLSAHWLACIWYAIGISEKNHRASWINVLARNLYANGSVDDVPISSRYITSLYFTLSSLTSVGFGNVASNTNAEKYFAVVLMLLGALMFATIFGNLTAIIQRLYSKTSKYHKTITLVREFIKFYEIPSPLSDRLEECTRHKWNQTKGLDLQKVLDVFPESLQSDVCYHLRKDLFESISAFKEADSACLRLMATKFRTLYYLTDQCIIKQGDTIKQIYFIASGVVEVVRDSKPLLSLGKGDIISCDYKSWQNIPKANSDLTARNMTEVHSIDYDDLIGVLKAYPVFGQTFFQRLEVSYRLQDFDNATDEFAERSRQFTNARFELESFHKFAKAHKEPQLHSNGTTCIEMETIIPAATRKIDEEKSGADKDIDTDTASSENRHIANRLSNIEDRLSSLEENITSNFNEILQHIQGNHTTRL